MNTEKNKKIVEYPWLFPTWDKLMSMLSNGLPHSILLNAPNGFGKHIVANELAKLLLCQGEKPNNIPCGHCSSCGWFERQEEVTQQCHPDCYPVSSDSDSGIIKIDAVRDLISNLSQTANQSGWKICLIFKAHFLNIQAFNALLKTLEEPTSNTLFILLVDNIRVVPMTILSRTQNLQLSLNDANSRECAITWLCENGKYNEEQVAQALQLSADAPLLAREFLHSNKITQYQQWLQDLTKLQNQTLGIVDMANNWKELKQENIIWLCQLIRDKMTQKSTTQTVMNYREWLNYEQILRGYEKSWLQNLNENLVLQNVYAQWQEYHNKQPLD
jgi:DNA polymerase-3 subunit delta'